MSAWRTNRDTHKKFRFEPHKRLTAEELHRMDDKGLTVMERNSLIDRLGMKMNVSSGASLFPKLSESPLDITNDVERAELGRLLPPGTWYFVAITDYTLAEAKAHAEKWAELTSIPAYAYGFGGYTNNAGQKKVDYVLLLRGERERALKLSRQYHQESALEFRNDGSAAYEFISTEGN